MTSETRIRSLKWFAIFFICLGVILIALSVAKVN